MLEWHFTSQTGNASHICWLINPSFQQYARFMISNACLCQVIGGHSCVFCVDVAFICQHTSMLCCSCDICYIDVILYDAWKVVLFVTKLTSEKQNGPEQWHRCIHVNSISRFCLVLYEHSSVFHKASDCHNINYMCSTDDVILQKYWSTDFYLLKVLW